MPRASPFPRPMKGSAQPDFSFSGLKTAVRQAATRHRAAVGPGRRRHLRLVPGGGGRCAGRPRRPQPCPLPRRVSRRSRAGAGRGRRRRRQSRRSGRRWKRCARGTAFAFVAPPLELCTDNAAMIAWAGIERLRAGLADDRRHAFRAALALAARQRLGARCRLRPAGSQGMSGGSVSVAVLGGGAWGTALAHRHAARRPRRAALGARRRDRRGDRSAAKIRAICRASRSTRRSRRRATSRQRCDGADCVLAVTPAQSLRAVLAAAGADIPNGVPLVLCAKGIERDTGKLLSAIAERDPARTIRSRRCPARASPPTSRRGLPTAVVVAARDEALAADARRALFDRAFPLLFDRRPDRRRDRRRAEERLRDRRRRGHRRRARRQRAGRHGDARLRRIAPHRRSLRRAAGDADGTFRPRRSAAHLRIGAVAQFRLRAGARARRAACRPAAGRRRADGGDRRPHRHASAASTRRSSPPSPPILDGAITIDEAVSA